MYYENSAPARIQTETDKRFFLSTVASNPKIGLLVQSVTLLSLAPRQHCFPSQLEKILITDYLLSRYHPIFSNNCLASNYLCCKLLFLYRSLFALFLLRCFLSTLQQPHSKTHIWRFLSNLYHTV